MVELAAPSSEKLRIQQHNIIGISARKRAEHVELHLPLEEREKVRYGHKKQQETADSRLETAGGNWHSTPSLTIG